MVGAVNYLVASTSSPVTLERTMQPLLQLWPIQEETTGLFKGVRSQETSRGHKHKPGRSPRSAGFSLLMHKGLRQAAPAQHRETTPSWKGVFIWSGCSSGGLQGPWIKLG